MAELPPFLRLAAETRDQIYGYLLSTKYTKHYSKELDPEWENHKDHRGNYYEGPRPTHTYRFHVGILGANHQINREARNVLYEQNMFVKVTWRISGRELDLGGLGVPIVAKGSYTFGFENTVLQVQMKPNFRNYSPAAAPMQIIFAGTDMPAFCTALTYGGKSYWMVPHSSLLITLNCNTSDGDNRIRNPFSIPRLKSLLEPLRFVHSFYSASITGPLDKQYKTDLSLSICKQAPSLEGNLSEVEKKVREHKEYFAVQDPVDYHHAVRVYSNAMVELKDRCSRLVPSGADKLYIEYITLVFALQTCLTNAYFQLEQYDQSRKWSERAMRIFYDRLGISVNPHPDYARACLVNVRSNIKLGRWKEAVDSMKVAVTRIPDLEEELKPFEEDARKHEERRKERQLKTVKTVLAENRSQKGRPLVIRYPGDFDKVLNKLCAGDW